MHARARSSGITLLSAPLHSTSTPPVPGSRTTTLMRLRSEVKAKMVSSGKVAVTAAPCELHVSAHGNAGQRGAAPPWRRMTSSSGERAQNSKPARCAARTNASSSALAAWYATASLPPAVLSPSGMTEWHSASSCQNCCTAGGCVVPMAVAATAAGTAATAAVVAATGVSNARRAARNASAVREP